MEGYNNRSDNGQNIGNGQFTGNSYYTQPGQMPMQPYYGQPPMQPGSTGTGRRVGYFFLALLPIVVCFAAQFGLALIWMIVKAAIAVANYTASNPYATQAQLMEVYNRAVWDSLSGGMLAYHIASLPIFGLWYRFCGKKPRFKQSFSNMRFKAVVLAAFFGISAHLLSLAIVGVEQFAVPSIVEAYVESAESVGMGTNGWVIFATICLAPIGEELLCRGLVLYYAKQSFGRFWPANILQAFLFGVIHANWVQGVYAFAIGLVLGYLTERYQSLIPAMATHFVVNLISSVGIMEILLGSWFPDVLPAYLLLFVVSLAVILLLGIWGGSVVPEKRKKG